MTTEQKQLELQRHRDILLATYDYLLQRNAGCFVTDGFDSIAETFEQEKQRTNLEFKQGRLGDLQQRLQRQIETFCKRADANFPIYIKKNTGYHLNIFEDLQKRIDAIVAQNEIRSQNELNDVYAMLHFYLETAPDENEVNKLNSLLSDYFKTAPQATGEYSEVISSAGKDGIKEVTVRVSTGPKPEHVKEQEETSPDGKRQLRVVQWSDGNCASTYMEIRFPKASGPVFGMSGIHDVKAFWKDNFTIVIEMPKNYAANTRHKQVRSFDDIISIEYIEI